MAYMGSYSGIHGGPIVAYMGSYSGIQRQFDHKDQIRITQDVQGD